jgi:hypothetical protein
MGLALKVPKQSYGQRMHMIRLCRGIGTCTSRLVHYIKRISRRGASAVNHPWPLSRLPMDFLVHSGPWPRANLVVTVHPARLTYHSTQVPSRLSHPLQAQRFGAAQALAETPHTTPVLVEGHSHRLHWCRCKGVRLPRCRPLHGRAPSCSQQRSRR